MLGIVPSQRRHMTRRATEPGGHGTTFQMNRVGAHNQIGCCGLAAMTGSARIHAGAMTGIANGGIPRQGIDDSVDMHIQTCDLKTSVDHCGVTFSTVKPGGSDMEGVFPTQASRIVAGIVTTAARRLTRSCPDRTVVGVTTSEVAMTIGVAAGAVLSIPRSRPGIADAMPTDFRNRIDIDVSTVGCDHRRQVTGVAAYGRCNPRCGEVLGVGADDDRGVGKLSVQTVGRRPGGVVPSAVSGDARP